MTKHLLFAGVDEAGRGPLAGPVLAAAVILPDDFLLPGLTDSKKLSAINRQQLEPLIKQQAITWAVAEASAAEIDELNILQATMLAMSRAVAGLHILADHVLVDGNREPDLTIPCTCIIKGDLTEPAISAASVLAKEARDRLLIQMHADFPVYGFAQHKAYPTAAHLAALKEYGPCPEHRRSFRPVRECL
ncbi:MAG: ribonuclease HII [Parvicella sp.]|jgi:ribonuclease HII